MNNNQFKKLIRQQIEVSAQDHGLIVWYVDTSATTRIYYVYNNDYKPLGTISVWIGNESFSLSYYKDPKRLVNIAHYHARVSGNFLEIGELIDFIKTNMMLDLKSSDSNKNKIER